MTFFDFIKSLIDASKERLKTPITGAFIWSFLIYNWRPIAVLFFSNAPIEDRIVVINDVYCKPFAIIIPIVIAFIYTIGVPMLMVKIDKILAKTKDARINKIYADKGTIMEGKIKIAEKEFELKNKESGNKQIEDLLNQIEGLKESNSQMATAHNISINQLNKELEQANINNNIHSEKIGSVVKRGTARAIVSSIPNTTFSITTEKERILNYNLNEAETNIINRIIKLGTKSLDLINIPEDVLNNFINAGVIRKKKNGTGYAFTDFGLKYIDNY